MVDTNFDTYTQMLKLAQYHGPILAFITTQILVITTHLSSDIYPPYFRHWLLDIETEGYRISTAPGLLYMVYSESVTNY